MVDFLIYRILVASGVFVLCDDYDDDEKWVKAVKSVVIVFREFLYAGAGNCSSLIIFFLVHTWKVGRISLFEVYKLSICIVVRIVMSNLK